MEKLKLISILIILGLFFQNCDKHTKAVSPITNDQAPKPVSNITVKNLPGGARISYKLPNSKTLQYVEAVFHLPNGKRKQVKASHYNNSLKVQGFPDTTAYQGKLVTVSRGENESKPISFTIHPKEPPFKEVFKTLHVKKAFGGIQVNFKNVNQSELVVSVLTSDSLGEMVDAKKYYTENEDGKFYLRGLAAKKRKFGIYIEDQYNHYSDTLYTSLTPIYEELLDKSKFKWKFEPNDQFIPFCCGFGVNSLYNNKKGPQQFDHPVGFHTLLNAGIPLSFTFDMGVKARLSRFKLYSLPAMQDVYVRGDPKKFEIWGSNNPAPSWDVWTKLGTFTDEIPSGQENPTKEDWLYATRHGKDFQFEDATDLPAVRYLRFKILETWGGVSFMYINELTFWGQVTGE